jgi:hypothetical protein
MRGLVSGSWSLMSLLNGRTLPVVLFGLTVFVRVSPLLVWAALTV